MKKIVKYVGLDVHKDSITIAIADQGRNGEVRIYGKIANNLNQIDKFVRKLTSKNAQLHCVYEAGPCGYILYRHLTNKGIDCAVVAPALIPKKSGDRVKNDRRDATKLATLHRAGELTAVYVPDQEDEAIRDLVRARADIRTALRKVKQQINAFLLRHGIGYPGKTKWSKAHLAWLTTIKMAHPAQQIALTEYLRCHGKQRSQSDTNHQTVGIVLSHLATSSSCPGAAIHAGHFLCERRDDCRRTWRSEPIR
jgi:transposase